MKEITVTMLLAMILRVDVIAGLTVDSLCLLSEQREEHTFTLSMAGKSAPLFISPGDYPGVIRAFKDLQTDIGRVTGAPPTLTVNSKPRGKEVVIAGTIGKSHIIDRLIRKGAIDVKEIAGRWECFLIEVIEKPVRGVNKALIIAGSDKRGTIYGIYELSRQIGVSPWYWWADVPVKKNTALFIHPGPFTSDEPSVKYRGLFLNDEAPALTNWVAEKYGMVKPSVNPPIPPGVANYGHEFYEKIFEVILRLRGNYLWPAMWNNAFNEDDPENPRLADEYGIIMGTSHQEPMLRAQKEWDRRYYHTLGRWNYVKHPEVLEQFWREGIRRNRDYESIITIGLRGADDTEMLPGGPAVNIPFLEKIVAVQRQMIAEEINPDVTRVPQLWCLYKEVQEYYEQGMRVPGDVTLLWAEDNWGNLRRVPDAEERRRSGGAGIYYHFDYHGGPRSYQWINTNPIPKIWDQMTLAKQYGADRIWIVNAGHFKGYEFPLEYFLNLAWDTDRFTADNILEYTRSWAAREFGERYATEIAEIISRYTKYNGRRKPELLEPTTYSLVNYGEAEKVVADYKTIAIRAEEIYHDLPEEMHDAFYQLVLFPVKACALVNELYLTAGKNYLFARQGRAAANDMADETQRLFEADTALMGYYNRIFANGKWNHFMDQTHLGYTSWRDPVVNSLQHLSLKRIEIPDTAEMGVAIEGSEESWPGNELEPQLPEFDIFNKQNRYIDIFNKGNIPFQFTASPDRPWIIPGRTYGTVEMDYRLWISIDWAGVPAGRSTGTLTIRGAGSEVTVGIHVFYPQQVTPETLRGFVEGEGYVAIEAEHFTRKTDEGDRQWIRIEDYGHTLSGMRAVAPVDAPPATSGKDSPCLEYQVYLFTTGQVAVTSILSPTLNFMAGRGLHFAVSIDDEPPQVITIVPEGYNAQNFNTDWENSVRNNARFITTNHTIGEEGYHTLKIWMVDPGVVVQRLVIDCGGVRPSYLGPPESYHRLSYEK